MSDRYTVIHFSHTKSAAFGCLVTMVQLYGQLVQLLRDKTKAVSLWEIWRQNHHTTTSGYKTHHFRYVQSLCNAK